MRTSQLSRALSRLAAVLAGTLAVGAVGLPAAHATNTTVNLVLGPGQSGSIGTVVTNTQVTPVPTCDPELSVSFDTAMAGTVTVAPDAAQGSYACSVDFQISGQSTGLTEHVVVDVPGLSINDVAIREGTDGITPGAVHVDAASSGVTTAAFTVTLSEASGSTVTVAVATADGTASKSDYTAVDTTVTFPPGATTETVDVLIDHDSVQEPDETYFVDLSAPTGAAITDDQGLGTILDDDGGIFTRGIPNLPASEDQALTGSTSSATTRLSH